MSNPDSGKQLSTYHARQINLLDGIDNPKADVQLQKSWLRLQFRTSPYKRHGKGYGTPRSLTHDHIKNLHTRLLEQDTDVPDIYRGRYRYDLITPRERNHNRNDGKYGQSPGFIPPNRVQKLMDKWLQKYADPRKDFDPIEAHIEFEKIHPFMVANGRTGRVILAWHQKSKGLPITRFTDKDE